MNLNVDQFRTYSGESFKIKSKKKRPGVYGPITCRKCGCVDKTLRKCSDGHYICEDCLSLGGEK